MLLMVLVVVEVDDWGVDVVIVGRRRESPSPRHATKNSCAFEEGLLQTEEGSSVEEAAARSSSSSFSCWLNTQLLKRATPVYTDLKRM